MSAETEADLQRAITAHLVDEGLINDGEFVGDWIANVYLPSVERNGESAYSMIMSGGVLPDHVAIGLAVNLLDRLRGITLDEED